MKRRHFISSVLGSVAGSLILPNRAWAATAAKLDRIGLELYTIRGAMKADPERTLAAVRAMGYSDVELLWSFKNFGRTPQQTRATLDKEGLRAPSCHMSPETILTDWDKSLDTARLLGHEYLIVPDLGEKANKSLDEWKLWADRFNTAGATARKAGIWLAFHSEPNHMKPIDGVVPYDLFLSRTDPSLVRQQLDVGNMLMGGADPMAYLERYKDRYWSFHLKDVVADRSSDTELGNGTFDFKRFLAAVPSLARTPCYVEQEGPKDEMASAKMSADFLKKLEF
jgi:sugar phosphate isomerase/epimerase